MNQPTERFHTPSILILLASALGVMAFITFGLTLAVQGLVGLYTGTAIESTLTFMMSGGLIFTGLLAMPGGYYSLRRLMGHPPGNQPALIFGTLDWLVLLTAWPLLILLGHYILETQTAWLVMPVISIIAAAIPIAFILRLALNRLQIGTRQRVWGVLGLGLTISPLVILVFETIILVLAVATAIIVLAMQPERLDAIAGFVALLENASEEQILSLVGPLVFQPAGLLALFGFVAVAVPLVEEMFKTLPLWFFGKKLNNPIEGFLLGAVSGAAFALFENIGYAANDTEMWATTTLARIGAGSMHILTGGLMGWALALAFTQRKYLRLAGIYLLVVVIHALWNALGVSMGLGVIAGLVETAPSFWRNAPLTALAALLTLGVGAIVVLLRANRRMQAEQSARVENQTPSAE